LSVVVKCNVIGPKKSMPQPDWTKRMVNICSDWITGELEIWLDRSFCKLEFDWLKHW